MRSASSIRYSIVVPFYNEQENVSPLYMKLTEVMEALGEPYELVFVDDGSRDNTFKVLSDIYEHDRCVNLVRLREISDRLPALKRDSISHAAKSLSPWTEIYSTTPRRFRAFWKRWRKATIW